MKHNPLLGAAVGAAGGLLGSGVMVAFQHLVGGSSDKKEDNGSNAKAPEERRGADAHRANADPNDTDGTVPDVPATVQVADRLSRQLLDHPPSDREKKLGGSAVHYAFGAAIGALYGMTAEVAPRTAAGAGLPFGAAVWLAADEIGVPLAGLAKGPGEYPITRHASALGSHLLYGLTVEGVRRALLGRAHAPH